MNVLIALMFPVRIATLNEFCSAQKIIILIRSDNVLINRFAQQ